MNKDDFKERVRQQRAAMLETVAPMAERDLYDERYDWLRTPGRRRALVIVTVACVLTSWLAVMADWPLLALITLLSFLGLIFLLRRVGRSIVDLPDELVDERMREVRGLVYRWAYIGMMTCIPMLFVADILLALAEKFEILGLTRLTGDQWSDGLMTVFFLGMALPSMIHVWVEPEL